MLVILSLNVADSVQEKDNILSDLGIDTSLNFEKLKVTFGSSSVDFGNHLDMADVEDQPTIEFGNYQGGNYLTLAMVDPDAPNPKVC